MRMLMLLWKDYRLNRVVLPAGVLLILAPYLLIGRGLSGAWGTSAYLAQFTVALIAGNVIACERADRSAEFLAYQGATRAMATASKMILCAMVYAAVCLVTFVTSLWLPETGLRIPGGYYHSWNDQLRAAATGLGFFGCGWLFSSFLTSPVLAVTLGCAVPLSALGVLSISARATGWPDDFVFGAWHVAICSGVGVLALVAGTWHYLRSRES